ncbi:hypothetical protein GCM10010260_44780 [Streptomyces filipinensis]|uniref:Uncharacterized protein n=1 Tax=Streptomyces filipinensis TaxID=66887 RepID=A0A918MBU6_9ACTN|nr:hypothetical protein GCM10010260_44780 [Streptomyces filipinensis]
MGAYRVGHGDVSWAADRWGACSHGTTAPPAPPALPSVRVTAERTAENASLRGFPRCYGRRMQRAQQYPKSTTTPETVPAR